MESSRESLTAQNRHRYRAQGHPELPSRTWKALPVALKQTCTTAESCGVFNLLKSQPTAILSQPQTERPHKLSASKPAVQDSPPHVKAGGILVSDKLST